MLETLNHPSEKTVQDRVDALAKELVRLLDVPHVAFRDAKPAAFPEAPGVYVIYDQQGAVLRAGKTSATLRQRLYTNHLMGSQNGNLAAQLTASGVCGSRDAAKDWIRKNCFVQWLEIWDDRNRGFLEHFMLAVLEPRFCDKNKQD